MLLGWVSRLCAHQRLEMAGDGCGHEVDDGLTQPGSGAGGVDAGAQVVVDEVGRIAPGVFHTLSWVPSWAAMVWASVGWAAVAGGEGG